MPHFLVLPTCALRFKKKLGARMVELRLQVKLFRMPSRHLLLRTCGSR